MRLSCASIIVIILADSLAAASPINLDEPPLNDFSRNLPGFGPVRLDFSPAPDGLHPSERFSLDPKESKLKAANVRLEFHGISEGAQRRVRSIYGNDFDLTPSASHPRGTGASESGVTPFSTSFNLPPTAPVPEPSTFLFGLAVMGACMARRTTQRSS